MLLILALQGCGPLLQNPDDTALAGVPSGVSYWVRTLTGEAVAPDDVRVVVGAIGAEPGSDGVAIFPTIYPGRVVARLEELGETRAWAPSFVAPTYYGNGQIYGVPMTPWTAEVVQGGAVLSVDSTLSVNFAADALLLDGEVATQSVQFLGGVLAMEHSRAMPGDFLMIANDDVIAPIELYAVARIQPSKDQGSWQIVDPGPVRWTQPIDAEVLSAEGLQLVRFDVVQGYWKAAGPLTIESQTLVGGAVGQFGWYGIAGAPQVPRGCVSGNIQSPGGEPLPGAEVMFTEAGRFGVHRSWADGDGKWCAEPVLGVDVSASAFFVDGFDLTRRYSLETTLPLAKPGSCQTGGCADAGTLVLGVLGQ